MEVDQIEVVPFVPAHFPVLLAWFKGQADLVQWGGPVVRAPLDEAQLRALLAEQHSDPPTRLCWTGLVDGEPCAHAQLVLDRAQGVGRLARVATAPQARGLGFAVPFLQEILARAFAESWLYRLELNVRADNAPALRTYAALGFVPEGVRRSAVSVGGQRWDIAIQSMLRPEYEAGQAKPSAAPHANPTSE